MKSFKVKKVIVRPGDKVTHAGILFEGDVFTVVTAQTYKDGRGYGPPSDKSILVVDDASGRYRCFKPNHMTQLGGETVSHYVDEATAVTARPGDTITWHGTEAVVISRQEWESYNKTTRYPTVLPSEGALAWTTPEGPPTWSSVNDAELRLNGGIITHFEDAVATTPNYFTDKVFMPTTHTREPAATTPRLGTQEPDEDGMVIGWDGRKVWL